MKNNKITVSIIMATYNRAHFIKESIKYIQQQTFKNFECLIIDDGCTDNTSGIVPDYIKGDQRFHYLKRKEKYKKGLPGCRNYGLDIAKGDFIVFFDDDDIAHPDLLLFSVKEIVDQNTDYCRYLRSVFSNKFQPEFDRSEDYTVMNLREMAVEKMITMEIPFNSCQVLWSSTCFLNLRFDEKLMFAEEWELYSRILLSGKKGISLEKALYFGRKHQNSNTGEFNKNDNIRVNSKIVASKNILENLNRKFSFTQQLQEYFIRLSFSLKSYDLLIKTLHYSDFNTFTVWKYKLGYLIYPVLRPFLKLKGKLKSV